MSKDIMTDSMFVSNIFTPNFVMSYFCVLPMSHVLLLAAFRERSMDFLFRPRDDATKGTVKNELDHTV